MVASTRPALLRTDAAGRLALAAPAAREACGAVLRALGASAEGG